jgi:hypothetical protein
MPENFNEIPEYGHFLGSPPIGDILYEDSSVVITRIKTLEDFQELIKHPAFNEYRRSNNQDLNDLASDINQPNKYYGFLLIHVLENNDYIPLYLLMLVWDYKIQLVNLKRGVKLLSSTIDDLNSELTGIEEPLIEAAVKFICNFNYKNNNRVWRLILVGEFGVFFKVYAEDHPFLQRLYEECSYTTDFKWAIFALLLRYFDKLFKSAGSKEIFGETVILEREVGVVKLIFTYEEVSEFFRNGKNIEAALEGNWSSENPEVYDNFYLYRDDLMDFIQDALDSLSEKAVLGIKNLVLGREIEWFNPKDQDWQPVVITEKFLTEEFAESVGLKSKSLREVLYALLSDKEGKKYKEGENYEVFYDLYDVFRQAYSDAGASVLDSKLRDAVLHTVQELLNAHVNSLDESHVEITLRSGSIFRLFELNTNRADYDTLRDYVSDVAYGEIDFSDVLESVYNSIRYTSVVKPAVAYLEANFGS